MFKKRIFNVFNSYFKVNGVTLLANENLTSASLAREVQEAIIRNGIGNKVWSKLEYDAELTVEMQTNVMSFEQIAMACGSAIASGVKNVYTSSKTYTPNEAKKITLSSAPVTTSEVEIVDLSTDEIIENSNYNIEGSDVTFTEKPKGDVKVLPYKTLIQNAKVINIASDKFSEAGELILTTYAVDENSKVTDEVVIVIPKAKPSSNFTIATSSDVSGGNDNTTTVVALDDNGSFGEIYLNPLNQK